MNKKYRDSKNNDREDVSGGEQYNKTKIYVPEYVPPELRGPRMSPEAFFKGVDIEGAIEGLEKQLKDYKNNRKRQSVEEA